MIAGWWDLDSKPYDRTASSFNQETMCLATRSVVYKPVNIELNMDTKRGETHMQAWKACEKERQMWGSKLCKPKKEVSRGQEQMISKTFNYFINLLIDTLSYSVCICLYVSVHICRSEDNEWGGHHPTTWVLVIELGSPWLMTSSLSPFLKLHLFCVCVCVEGQELWV